MGGAADRIPHHDCRAGAFAQRAEIPDDKARNRRDLDKYRLFGDHDYQLSGRILSGLDWEVDIVALRKQNKKFQINV